MISKDDCKKDMLELGLLHGTKGHNKLTDELRSICVTSTETINLELYETGFNKGWRLYCSSYNGFEMGRKADTYRSFCPLEKEDLFHEKFLIGKMVYEKNDQVMDIEDKINKITFNPEKEASSLNLQKDELKRLQDYLRSLKNEIQALEQKGTSLVHTN
jgi:hypothetical protein